MHFGGNFVEACSLLHTVNIAVTSDSEIDIRPYLFLSEFDHFNGSHSVCDQMVTLWVCIACPASLDITDHSSRKKHSHADAVWCPVQNAIALMQCNRFYVHTINIVCPYYVVGYPRCSN